jgi:hypothetical protein
MLPGAQLAINVDSAGETIVTDAPAVAEEHERGEQAGLFAPVQTMPGQMALDLSQPS